MVHLILSSEFNAYLKKIIFLNYDPYEYLYFSKCTSYVVSHVSHTNQVT